MTIKRKTPQTRNEMSSNKLKYFTVTTTSVVAANNKKDAGLIARGRRGVTGKLMEQEESIDRISAAEARGERTMTA